MRTGQTPINYDTFYQSISDRGLAALIQFKYPIYAEYSYRAGVFHLVEGHYICGDLMMLTALIMQPGRLSRLFRQRFGKRS